MLSNHDVTRVVTRYGRSDTTFSFAKRIGTPTQRPQLGTRRAHAATLLVAALPGTLYVYQGEELGLPEVEDLPLEQLQDPMHFQSQGAPIRTSGSTSPCRGPTLTRHTASDRPDSTPWLPQPASWAALSVAAERGDPASMLTLSAKSSPSAASGSAA